MTHDFNFNVDVDGDHDDDDEDGLHGLRRKMNWMSL